VLADFLSREEKKLNNFGYRKIENDSTDEKSRRKNLEADKDLENCLVDFSENSFFVRQ
jgi:hypothetical protein